MVDELKAVLRLSEAATPAPWEVSLAVCGEHDNETVAIYNRDSSNGYVHVREVIESTCKCGDEVVSKEDSEFIAATANFLRDHGQALVEAVRDAERYRWIREVASGDPADFHHVEDAAFVSANGSPHNFDLNIDLARTKAGAGGEK